jgi:hypothetical protein
MDHYHCAHQQAQARIARHKQEIVELRRKAGQLSLRMSISGREKKDAVELPAHHVLLPILNETRDRSGPGGIFC